MLHFAASELGLHCLHMSPKQVSSLKGLSPGYHFSIFEILSDLVVTQLQKSQAVEETVTDPDLEKTVSEVMDKVKDIALTTKKSVQSAAAADG